jgi:hypothetical protein
MAYKKSKKQCKELPFKPEYFSGLNFKDAKKYIGCHMYASNNGQEWIPGGILKDLNFESCAHKKFQVNNKYYNYISTCSETFKKSHPTIKITVNGKDYNLPKPEVEEPQYDTICWVITQTGVYSIIWKGTCADTEKLRIGIIHLTRIRAQAWVDWWRKLINNTNNTSKKYINLYWNEINNCVEVGNCIFDKENEAKNNGKLTVNLCNYLKTVEIELPEGDAC